MREVLSVHIGQAGVQVGHSVWELLCAEHDLNVDGKFKQENAPKEDTSFETFFLNTPNSQYVPRSMFIDLEPTVVDEVRTGVYRELFHPDSIINSQEDAANNFARGFFTVGKQIYGQAQDQFRKMYENCDTVQAVVVYRSLGGGTGSGFTSAFFDCLMEYPKTPRIVIPIYPTQTLSMCTVEPYNCLLGEHFCIDDVDVSLLMDNEALYTVCKKYLHVSKPTFSTINRLVAQVCSGLTAPIRFRTVLGSDLTVLQTNMVPYPRIHFPLVNFAPALPMDIAIHETMSVQDLTRYVFEPDNQMVKCNASQGKYMSCCLYYRGDVMPNHVYNVLAHTKAKKRITFVDWCPTGFKVAITMQPPTVVTGSYMYPMPKNLTMLTNNTAVGEAWKRLEYKYRLLYSRRAFIHWFVGEGMEEVEIQEALSNVQTLVQDYNEAATDSRDLDSRTNTETEQNSAVDENANEADEADEKISLEASETEEQNEENDEIDEGVEGEDDDEVYGSLNVDGEVDTSAIE